MYQVTALQHRFPLTSHDFGVLLHAGDPGPGSSFGRRDLRAYCPSEHDAWQGLLWGLFQGGCIHALKLLIEKDYAAFQAEFATASVDSEGPGRPIPLVEAMQGRSYQEKLDMAWGLYARRKLADQGFDRVWERVYLELDEFEMVLGSMALCHFGAQYPCFSRQEPIPNDWWHLRLHL